MTKIKDLDQYDEVSPAESRTNTTLDSEEDYPDRPSKSQRKRDMTELQDLGTELVALSTERLAKIAMSDSLRIAIRDAQRITAHEGRRRQMQYIGKLMRSADVGPIREAIAALTGVSKAETARLHQLERLRDKLLEDETTLTEIGHLFPGADLRALRALRRNALKEHELKKPPRSFREIFKALKEMQENLAKSKELQEDQDSPEESAGDTEDFK